MENKKIDYLIKNGKKIKKNSEDVKAAAKGKPLNLSEISWGTVRENGLSFQAQGNPVRLNKIKEKEKDKNEHDKLYEKTKKEEKNKKKPTSEVNAKLTKARRAMNLEK
ncbi:MAG: hypothetical protein IJM98_08975 [Oscillospiraceae bacterium]|nr:hypothetical protein [Oscillospiraceae bacterium]